MTFAELHAEYDAVRVENSDLKARCEALESQVERLRAVYLETLELVKKLERGIIGPKTERLTPDGNQLAFDVLSTLLGAEGADPEVLAELERQKQARAKEKSAAKKRKPTGRKPLPAELPRVEIAVLPPEVEQEGLAAFDRIGEEVSEVVERRPASLVVVRVVRGKFVRKPAKSQAGEAGERESGKQDAAESEPGADATGEAAAATEVATVDAPDIGLTEAHAIETDTVDAAEGIAVETHAAEVGSSSTEQPEPVVLIGPPCELPIPKGMAGPGLLADTVVRRWVDHTPLYRLESVYARDGLPLARSTICTWHDAVGQLVSPLVDAMFADAMLAPYVCVDATGVLVQAKVKCRRAHFWVLIAPDRHVLFKYTRKHDIAAVDRVLAGYKGYLVADAATVYDHLYVSEGVVEVGCWAHVRRYFFKSLTSEPELATWGLDLIGSLFRIERDIAELGRKRRERARHKRSRPLVNAFFEWCRARQDEVLDDTPISKAVNYALNQEKALRRFLEDGRLPMHNNISEGHLRRQAVGRKNWLFLGSDDGGYTNARLTSLLASCQMHRIEPLAYLRDMLILLPLWPRNRVLDLAPCNWKQTLQQEHAQRLLAANPFRRVALGSVSDHQPEG